MGKKIQINITNPKAIEAYEKLPPKNKSKAIEQAILLLYKNKTYKDMFFVEDLKQETNLQKQKPNNFEYSSW